MRWFYHVVLPFEGKKAGKWLAEFRYLKDAKRFARLYPGSNIYKDEVI